MIQSSDQKKSVGALPRGGCGPNFAGIFWPSGNSTTTLLSTLVVGACAGLVEHANAPGDLFLALELVVEHAERSRLPFQGVTDDVALEEVMLLVLRARGVDGRKARNGHNESQ